MLSRVPSQQFIPKSTDWRFHKAQRLYIDVRNFIRAVACASAKVVHYNAIDALCCRPYEYAQAAMRRLAEALQEPADRHWPFHTIHVVRFCLPSLFVCLDEW